MTDTANSRMDKKTIIMGIAIIDLKEDAISPRRFINKWPAIMLAVKRIVRVIGRIKFLVISIRIIKLIRGNGVPDGRACIIMVLEALVQPNIIIANHIDKAMGSTEII